MRMIHNWLSLALGMVILSSNLQANPNRDAITPRGPAAFTPDMSFGQALNILRQSTEPPLNIIVRWRDLAMNADLYPDTPIGIEGVSGVPLRTHIECLLLGVSGNDPTRIGYTVHRGVVFIGTPQYLPRPQITRVYDVTDLAPRPRIPMLPYGGLRLPPPSVGNQPILNNRNSSSR